MSQDWMQQGPPPPPPPPPAYNPYGYSGAPPPTGGSGAIFPWEDRARLGLVTALIETGKLLITQPREAYSRLQPNGDLTSPLLFGLIISWPVFIVSLVWQLLMGGMMGSFGGSTEAAGMSILSLGMYAVFYPILYLIGIFITSGIVHLTLSLIKGLEQSNFGFEGTLKVVAYAYVGQIAGVVPVIGGLIALGILIYLGINGLQVVHRTSQKNAILAIVLPIAVCCICLVIMFGVFGAALMAAFSGASGG